MSSTKALDLVHVKGTREDHGHCIYTGSFKRHPRTLCRALAACSLRGTMQDGAGVERDTQKRAWRPEMEAEWEDDPETDRHSA